jgi:tripartite-type tricarboxylate transporter receptor subunit TctC
VSFQKLLGKFAVAATMLLLPVHAGAADDFYKGKTIRIIVGFGPGGGYETYANLLSQHMGQHIPGRPNIVVENMPGAGSINAANYVYAVAPKDGTVIATVDQTAPMHQLLGASGARFNSGDLQWLGSLAHTNALAYTWYNSGINTIEDAKKNEVKLGAVSVSNGSYIFPTIVDAVLGTRFKMVLGYPDGPSIDIAIERGEVAGNGSASWLTLLTNHHSWLDEKKINILLQIGVEKERDLPNVPLLADLVKDTEDRELSDLISVSTSIGWGFWVAPGVPADRLAILRTAFDETLKDPGLYAEAAKLSGEIRPQSGAEIDAEVKRIADTPQKILDRANKMLNAQN